MNQLRSFFETLRVHHGPYQYVDERAVYDALVESVGSTSFTQRSTFGARTPSG
jgi:hypothetical protein